MQVASLTHCRINARTFVIYFTGFNLQSQSSAEKFHVCPLCQKTFTHDENMQKHLRNHNGNFTFLFLITMLLTDNLILDVSNPFGCEECSMRYDELRKLRAHYTLKHSDKEFPRHYIEAIEGSRTCSICSMKCKSRHALENHLQRHSDERRKFVCEVCSMRYHAIAQLKRHITKYHPGVKIPDHLNMGTKVHGKCSICFRVFNSSHDLQAHAKLHSGKFCCATR